VQITGAAIGVGYQILNRKEKGDSENDDVAGVSRSAVGGAVLFGGLYIAAPGWLRASMGFEPIVPGRTAALQAMQREEDLGSTSHRGWCIIL